jgi:hypothetical protein
MRHHRRRWRASDGVLAANRHRPVLYSHCEGIEGNCSGGALAVKRQIKRGGIVQIVIKPNDILKAESAICHCVRVLALSRCLIVSHRFSDILFDTNSMFTKKGNTDLRCSVAFPGCQLGTPRRQRSILCEAMAKLPTSAEVEYPVL